MITWPQLAVETLRRKSHRSQCQVEIGYVGLRGIHLATYTDLDQLAPANRLAWIHVRAGDNANPCSLTVRCSEPRQKPSTNEPSRRIPSTIHCKRCFR